MNNKQIEDLVDLMFDTDMEEVMKEKSTLEYIHKLQQENKQLKEKIDKLKDYIVDELKEYEKGIENYKKYGIEDYTKGMAVGLKKCLELLGDKE